ncbi:CoA-binding protein [Candidatus Poribacteria bacterium]|nr:CoA-binding protein [Candidatus Poribacteria bacterium]
MKFEDFRSIFQPRSVAVIGASNDASKFGGQYYFALRARAYSGKLFAVNPKVPDIDGVPTYMRMQDIPDEVEFAVVAVPAAHVVQAIADCAEKRVRVVEILTAGFGESGTPEGARWENEIIEIARRNGTRIIGPNCFGVYSPESALTLLPGIDFPKEGGPVGILSQSGGVTSFLMRKAIGLGVRFSKVISYGNGCDLNEIDFLSYFEADEQTKIVVAYLEGVSDGKRLLELVKKTTLKKPVIIWKGGLSKMGSRAVASHTASLGGKKEIWDGFFRQTGAIPAVGTDDLLDMMIGFGCLPGFQGRRVSVVGGGGAITVAAADALDQVGLSIPEFSVKTQQAIRACLPPTGNSVKNPIDVGTPVYLPHILKPVLEAAASDSAVEAVIVEQWVSNYMPVFVEELADVIPSVKKSSGKPFIATMPEPSASSETIEIEDTRRKYREHYLRHGIPVFDTLQRAATTLGRIVRYNEFVKERQA